MTGTSWTAERSRRSVPFRTAPPTATVAVPAAVRTPLARRPRHHLGRVLVDLASALVLSALLLDPWTTSAPPPAQHALVAVLWVLLLSGARCNAPGPLPGGSGGLRRVLRASTGLVAAIGLAPGVVPGLVPASPEPLRLLVFATLLSTIAVAQRSHRAPGRRLGGGQRTRPTTAVVAGHARDVTRVVAELAADRRRSIEVTAVCVPATAKLGFDVPVVRGFDLLVPGIEAHGADVAIVLPCHHFDPLTLRRIGWQLESAGVHLVVGSGLIDVDRSRARTMRAGGLDLVHVRHAELTGARRLVKQLWERPAAVLGLALLSPLLLVVAAAIRLESPGPAIFRQVRIGKDGEPFTMIKLRTMTVDAEDHRVALTGDDGAGPLFKMRADPRITRLGRLLRRYSIDELPQLVNVARGEMSLVGPRPPLSEEVLRYDGDTLRRLAVRPGMTGLWQVSGRSDLAWEETVRLDLRYVDNWSLYLDAVIIGRTLRAVVGHRGAY